MSNDRADLFSEVLRAVRIQQNAQDLFDEAACDWLGINRSDARALDILDLHGQMSAGRLASLSGLSTGAITTLVDRMERAGYVRRVRDTDDRRRVLVELTDAFRARAWEIWGPMAEEGSKSVERYSDAELAAILDFLRHAREVLGVHTERVRGLERPPRLNDEAAASEQ